MKNLMVMLMEVTLTLTEKVMITITIMATITTALKSLVKYLAVKKKRAMGHIHMNFLKKAVMSS